MATKKRWSQRVTETSDALTLDEGVFKREPAAIARSLKRSAERSKSRRSTPFRSAMSMLTFYGNRAGRKLSAAERRKIAAAKDELRKLYGKRSSTPKSGAKKSKSARSAGGNPKNMRSKTARRR